MMNLCLIQHGDAVSKDVDPDRPLSPQGVRDVQRLRDYLAEQLTGPRLILHSGKTRARQTSELLAEVLDPNCELRAAPGLQPKDPPKGFAHYLERETRDLIIVGHMPFLGRLLATLLSCDEEAVLVDFVPGTLVMLDRSEDGQWAVICVLRPDGIGAGLSARG